MSVTVLLLGEALDEAQTENLAVVLNGPIPPASALLNSEWRHEPRELHDGYWRDRSLGRTGRTAPGASHQINRLLA